MKPSYPTLYDDLTTYITGHPVVNTHCHQLPDREYEQFDLEGLFRNAYVNWSGVRWEATDPSRQNFLEKVRFHYAFVWLQKSLMKIYGFEKPLSTGTWVEWSTRIRSAHNTASFRQSILLERCNYHKMLLDAYWDPGSDNGDPGHFAPNFRINSFHFGFSPQAVDHDGNNPYTLYPRPFITDLDEYVDWVRECIQSHKAQGCVSLKLPIAYDRSLDFEEVSTDPARRAFERLVAANRSDHLEQQPSGEGKPIPSNAPDPFTKTGILSGPYAAEIKAFQDYLFFQICRIAAEQHLPIQIHTGMGQIKRTNALWLHEVIRKNPQTRFVLLHCSYPWIQDVMALVELYPNVFPDLSMLTLISTQASKTMLHDLIEAATADKITWGCDTWTPEESYGSLLAFRHALASVLAEKVSQGYCSVDDAQEIVDNVMFQNANRFYRLGL